MRFKGFQRPGGGIHYWSRSLVQTVATASLYLANGLRMLLNVGRLSDSPERKAGSISEAPAGRSSRSALGIDDLEMLARAMKRMLQPREFDRLQQIIGRRGIERLDCISVDGRDEDNRGKDLATRKPPDDLETVSVAHLDVEYDHVRREARDLRQSIFARRRLAYMLDVTDSSEQELEAP